LFCYIEGAPVELDRWTAVPGGISVIQLMGDAVIEAVPEDVLVVLVVEVLYRTPGGAVQVESS
jgi:hypothetical protein